MAHEPKSALARYAFGYSDDRKAAWRELIGLYLCFGILLLLMFG